MELPSLRLPKAATVTRKREYDIERMTTDALRALVAQCERSVRSLRAPYAKGRRQWASLGDRARRELERRG